MRRIRFGIWNLKFEICRNAAGFTLMEVIMIIVIVSVVDCDDLTTSDPGSGCRKITVTVYHSRIPNGVSLVGLRTAY
jgi:hypothetical protein